MAEPELLEFRLGLGRRFADQWVHPRSESKHDSPNVYKRPSISLEVNMFFDT